MQMSKTHAVNLFLNKTLQYMLNIEQPIKIMVLPVRIPQRPFVLAMEKVCNNIKAADAFRWKISNL